MKERKQLITVEQFRALARPTSTHVDEIEVKTFIRECEDRFIIPAIGYTNFKACLGMSAWDMTFDASFDPNQFLDGCEYESIEYIRGAKIKKLRYNCGIRKALAYFVYAKLLRSDGTIVSRGGAMRHRDDYSDHLDNTSLTQYNDVMSLAENYLSDALLYLKSKLNNRNIRPVHGSRAHIHAIGD